MKKELTLSQLAEKLSQDISEQERSKKRSEKNNSPKISRRKKKPKKDTNFFSSARVVMPQGKTQLTVRIDSDILDWMKAQGKGYQTRINAILRSYYEAHQVRDPSGQS